MNNYNHEKSRVNSLLPEFLKQDSVNLVSFLKQYYENEYDVVSSLIHNLTENLDLDRVSENKFIEQLANTVTKNVPSSDVVTRKFLIKRLVDYYDARGNTVMIDAFFRLFFNKKVEIFEPYTQVLIPSSGNFEPNLFLRIFNTTDNDPLELEGKTIIQTTANGQKIAEAFVREVQKEVFDETIFTLKIERNTVFGGFVKNLSIKDLNNNVYGNPYRTLKNFSIIKPGTGYEIGDRIFARNLPKATFEAEITNVGVNGEILNIKILNFGSGNTQDDTLSRELVDFNASGVIGINDEVVLGEEFIGLSNNSQIFHYGNRAEDQYNILEVGSANYFFEDYNSFNDTEYIDSIKSESSSIFNSNSELKFPVIVIQSKNGTGGEVNLNFDFLIDSDGTYLDTSGRLSSDIVLQDSDFYQKFSYEFSTDNTFEDYRSFYIDLLHPAGTKIFHNTKKNAATTQLTLDKEFTFGTLAAVNLTTDVEDINIPSTIFIVKQNYYEIDDENPKNYVLEDYLETAIRIND